MLGAQDLAGALDACPDAFVAVGGDRRITHWSGAAERLLGWSADEVLGQQDPSVPEDSMAATASAVQMLAAGLETGQSWQAPRRTRDGRRITVQLTAWVPLGDGAFGVFFRAPARDEEQSHLRNRLSAELSVAASRTDVIAAVGAALEGLVGATGTHVLVVCDCGEHLVTDPQGHCEPALVRGPWVDRERDPADAEGPRGVEHTWLHLDDQRQDHACLVPLGGRSAGTWMVVTGIHERAGDRATLVTVRAVADEAWVSLQRAELIGRLQGRVDALEALDASRTEAIAGVTHDLKAPVHVLRGFVETLRSRPAGTVDLDQAFDAMERQIGRIQRLVEDLLLAARAADGPIRPTDPRPVDLGELVDAIRDTLDPGARARVSVERHGALVVAGDDDQLGRVLTNLVDNALKYGGTDTAVDVALTGGPDRIRVVVRDHGPGLAADERDLVFQRFVVGRAGRETGGTGLGLHVAREIARGHGGGLRALPDDPAAPGAAFELWLPAAGPDPGDD